MNIFHSSNSMKANVKRNGRLFGFGTSPEADWKIILITTVLFTIATVSFSAYMFIEIHRGEFFQPDSQTSISTRPLDQELLEKVLAEHESREARLLEITANKEIIPDPSR